MQNADIQLLLNSLLFVFLMVRLADHFVGSASGRVSLIGLLTVVFGANAVLMLDRFTPAEAALRAFGCAMLFGGGVLVVAACNAWQRARKQQKESRNE